MIRLRDFTSVSFPHLSNRSSNNENCPAGEKPPTLILDGGLGTLLYSRGAFLKGDPLWSVRCLASLPDSEGRRQLRQAHLDYLAAGADVIKTNSYQMSSDHLRKCLPGLTQVLP